MSKLKLATDLSPKDNMKLKKEFLSSFRSRLRKLRLAKKLTQQQLAEKAGLHLTYVGHLELGKYMPTLFVAWKLARTLKVEVEDLID